MRRVSRLARPAWTARRGYCSSSSSSSSSTPPPPPLPPPEITGPTPPIRRVTSKLPDKMLKFGDPYQLQHLNAFLGFSSARTHPSAYNYLLGQAGGQAIINPEDTLTAMRRALHVVKKVSFRGGKTLFVSTKPVLARLCRVIGEQTDQYYLARRWVPGLLTNWQKSREHVQSKLRIDPRVKAAGRVKYSDLQKQNYFRGIEHMTRHPDLIFRLDDTPLYGEPAKLNVPLISVVDTNMPIEDVDYPVPANTKSLRFYHTLACMLVRAANEGTELRKELEYYDVRDLEAEESAAERGGPTRAQYERRGRGGSPRNNAEGRGGRQQKSWSTPDKYGKVRQ